MKSLSNFFTFTSKKSDGYVVNSSRETSTDSGHIVTSYPELLEKVAAIQYNNRTLQLLYRGQHKDYRLNASGNEARLSSLYPSIFRNRSAFQSSKMNAPEFVRRCYELLDIASGELVQILATTFDGELLHLLKKHKLLRWAILQHYEIVDTPLLDVTPTLNIALTFALTGSSGYLYMIGMPKQTDILTSSIIESTQSISLPQFCPPTFRRPHFQNGFLIGDYPPVENYDNHVRGESRDSYNFSKRLVTKFKIESADELKKTGFNPYDDAILMPADNDSFLEIANDIKKRIANRKQQLTIDLGLKRD